MSRPYKLVPIPKAADLDDDPFEGGFNPDTAPMDTNRSPRPPRPGTRPGNEPNESQVNGWLAKAWTHANAKNPSWTRTGIPDRYQGKPFEMPSTTGTFHVEGGVGDRIPPMMVWQSNVSNTRWNMRLRKIITYVPDRALKNQ